MLFYNIYISFAITLRAFLLKNFTSKNIKIDYILSIIFFLLFSSSSDVLYLKFLCSKSIAITMIILFHIVLFRVTVALKRLTSTQTLENIFMTNLFNLFVLLIFKYLRSFWEYKINHPYFNLRVHNSKFFSHLLWVIFVNDIIK